MYNEQTCERKIVGSSVAHLPHAMPHPPNKQNQSRTVFPSLTQQQVKEKEEQTNKGQHKNRNRAEEEQPRTVATPYEGRTKNADGQHNNNKKSNGQSTAIRLQRNVSFFFS